MIVVVEGSKAFKDYDVFMRSMAVALSNLKNAKDDIIIYTVGPKTINNYVSGFSNLAEDGMRARGMSIKYYFVSHSWVESHIKSVDYYIYLARPHERVSRLTRHAEKHDVEVGIFQF